MPDPPILILGVPRSGTSWIAAVLGSAPEVRLDSEPDNETDRPWALQAKRGLGRFPCLDPGSRAPRFERLWEYALSGSRYPVRVEQARRWQKRWLTFDAAEAACDPQRRRPLRALALAALGRPLRMTSDRSRPLVKSVHAVLCADWLASRFSPAIVVVQRDPFEIVASWRSLAAYGDGVSDRLEYAGRPRRLISDDALRRLTVRYGPPPSERDEAVAWLAFSLAQSLREFAARRPEVTVIDFDAACAEPRRVLGAAALALGLTWGPECEGTLALLNRPGTGWEVRRRSREVPGAWRRRLSASEIASIEAELERFAG